MACWKNILDGLIRALKILLDRNVVLDLHEDKRRSDYKGTAEENPIADKFPLVGKGASVEVVDHGSGGRLDTLVEADKVGRATPRIRQSTHEPMWTVSKVSRETMDKGAYQ